MSKIQDRLLSAKYMICIPSRSRSSMVEDRRGIWRYMNPKEKDYPKYLIVREEELETYLDKGTEGVSVRVVPNEFTIAQKRNEAIQMSKEYDVNYLFIIDDDVTFGFRDEDLPSKYCSRLEQFQKNNCFDHLLNDCMILCSKEFPIVGIPNRQGSVALKYMFPKNIPIIRFVCYHVPTLIKENISALGLGTTFMSDRYVHLTLLSKGYRSLSIAKYSVDDQGTGYKGGCSDTRDPLAQSLAAKKLQETFPDQVELKVKNDGKWKEERLDCKIHWRRFLLPKEAPFLQKWEGARRLEEEDYGI